MTHESEKNTFRDARSQFKNIEKALGEIDEGYAMNAPGIHCHLGQTIRIAVAALRALDMSVREIVDWGITNAIFRHAWLESFIDNNDNRKDKPEVQATIVLAQRMAHEINNSAFFFEGTERDVLKQEQDEAEQRYYKDQRIDAACDADNAKDEEFCGPDGKGEPE